MGRYISDTYVVKNKLVNLLEDQRFKKFRVYCSCITIYEYKGEVFIFPNDFNLWKVNRHKLYLPFVINNKQIIVKKGY
jgi:hypothetical protein